MNREADILAKTYQDKMTVLRKQPEVNPDTKETEYPESIILEEISCALSSGSSNAPERAEGYQTVQNDYVIFSRPEVLLQEGDIALVETGQGQKYRLDCGRSMAYTGHSETPARLERMI